MRSAASGRACGISPCETPGVGTAHGLARARADGGSFAPFVAEVSRKPYNQGRKDGRSGTIPIDPWSPPASEWTQAERDAYVAGFSAGRKSRSARGGSQRRRSSADAGC